MSENGEPFVILKKQNKQTKYFGSDENFRITSDVVLKCKNLSV